MKKQTNCSPVCNCWGIDFFFSWKGKQKPSLYQLGQLIKIPERIKNKKNRQEIKKKRGTFRVKGVEIRINIFRKWGKFLRNFSSDHSHSFSPIRRYSLPINQPFFTIQTTRQNNRINPQKIKTKFPKKSK